jgi:O-antigen/teichoic acid export membrane protein
MPAMLESAPPSPAGAAEPALGVSTAGAVVAPPDDPPADATPLRTRVARGTLVNTAFTVALGVLGLVKSFILASLVSRSDYGVWGVLMVTLGTLLWLKQVGIGDKFIQQDELDQEAAFQKAFTLELGFSGLLFVVMAAVIPVIVLIYGLDELILPGIVIAASLVISAFQAPLWVFYRRMQFARQRALAAVDPVVEFVVSIALGVAGAGYWAFVGGLAAGVFAAAAAAVIASPFRLRLRYEPGTLRSYLSFSGPLLIASSASFVMTWSAMIAAKLDLGVAALGVIALTSTIAAFTDSVDQLVTGTLYPAICAVKDQTALLLESFVKSNRLALIWAVPFGVGITLFCADLVHFGIGERWHSAIVVLQVGGIAAAVNHIGFNWTAYFRARGWTRPIAVANLAAMTVFLVVGIPLLVAFGLPGFAAAIALQGLAAFVLRAFYLERLFPGFVFIRHIVRALLPTVPAAALVLLLRLVEPRHRTLGIALSELALYVAVTVASTWLVERSLVREALAALTGRRPVVAAAS